MPLWKRGFPLWEEERRMSFNIKVIIDIPMFRYTLVIVTLEGPMPI